MLRAFSIGMLLAAALPGEALALPPCKEAWKSQAYAFDFREEYGAFQQRLKRKGCEKEWTVLVYMAADNNLFPYALWDLYEMEAAYKSSERAGSTLRSDLLVQVDGPGTNDLRRLHIFSGPVPFEERAKEDFEEATLEQVRSPVVARLSERGARSEGKRFEEFLLWGAENYPARNYMVVVWGHGQGWKAYPVGTPAKSRILREGAPAEFPKTKRDERFGGIAFRESASSWLDIPALSRALGTFSGKIGKPADIYASDACLMQMLEVAYELSPGARFVVGSSQVQSYLGLPYRRMMYELNSGHFNGLRKQMKTGSDENDEAYLLARMLPALMKQSLHPRHGLQGSADHEAYLSITSSALTAAELESELVPQLANLSRALRAYLLEDKTRVLELRFVLQNVPLIQGNAQDFGVFLGLLDQLVVEERSKQGGELSPAAAKLREAAASAKKALDRAVLAYEYGAGYGLDKVSRLVGYVPRAVALWLPVAGAEYSKRREEFLASRFYQQTAWQEWLDLLFPR